MVTSNPLNKILQGLMRRSSVIGKVYTNSNRVQAVPSKTDTTISSVTVPAGTYVIIGNMNWNKDTNVFVVASIRTNAGTLAIHRGTMTGGGGTSLAAVETFGTETEMAVHVYHQHTEPTECWANLRAIRIK